MTEEEWLACGNLESAIRFFAATLSMSQRKQRLFCCACCRRIEPAFADESGGPILIPWWELAERFGDGLANRKQLAVARREIRDFNDPDSMDDVDLIVHSAAEALRYAMEHPLGEFECEQAAWESRYAVAKWSDAKDVARLEAQEGIEQTRLLRDIFGNPLRTVTVSPAWQTANVVSLAQDIYDERAFDRMPILADALEDGGCTNQEILDHCRGPGPHVRGCWSLDLLLGKE
jgi:hypothetical protein